jgi:hypothetical protein
MRSLEADMVKLLALSDSQARAFSWIEGPGRALRPSVLDARHPR